MISPQRFRWPLLLFCGLGPSLTGSILLNQSQSNHLQRNGTPTTARVTNDEVGRGGHILNVSYFAGKQVHQSMLILTEEEYRQLPEQTRVPVVYDADHPATVELKGKQPRGFAVLYAGLVMTVIGVGGLVLANRMKPATGEP